MCVCVCVSNQRAELVAGSLPQAQLSKLHLHRIDDGEAAVPALVGQDHGEAALGTLRHDVAGWKHTHQLVLTSDPNL